MPILNPKTTAVPLEKPNTVRIFDPAFKGVTVDNRYTPASELLTYVEGSAWVTNYYSQVLDAGLPPAGQNLTLNPVQQQYKLIKGMEIRVTSPLTQSQSSEGGSMVVTGSAVLYPSVIPNVGDMFVADLSNGQLGVFQVNSAARKTIFRDTCYEVEYQLVDYGTQERLGDLTAKTIQTLQFVKDFLAYGQNPLVVEEVFIQGVQLTELYEQLLTTYAKQFISREYMTLVLPGQSFTIYDHYLTKAFMACFSSTNFPDVRKIRVLNCEDDYLVNGSSLWDAVLRRDASVLKYCVKQAGLTHARSFSRDPMLEGIYHSGVDYVVYPTDTPEGVNYSSGFVRKPMAMVSIDETLVPSTEETPLVKQVMVDDYYVFSQAFYDNAQTGQSQLELCVQRYLKKEPLDMAVLKTLATSNLSWGQLERFYYTPVLLMLIKASIRGI